MDIQKEWRIYLTLFPALISVNFPIPVRFREEIPYIVIWYHPWPLPHLHTLCSSSLLALLPHVFLPKTLGAHEGICDGCEIEGGLHVQEPGSVHSMREGSLECCRAWASACKKGIRKSQLPIWASGCLEIYPGKPVRFHVHANLFSWLKLHCSIVPHLPGEGC